MVCQGCGKKLKKNERFCTSCGFYNKPQNNSLENDALGNLEYFKDPYQDEEEIELLDDEEDDVEEIVYQDIDANEQDFNPNVTSDMDYYVKTYIGEDYNKIVNRPINIFALLLSWMYFVYRKLYLIGILGLFLTGVMIRKYFHLLPYYIVIVMILSAILFNPIYLFIVKKRVSKLMNQYDDSHELEDACSEKGGVNTPVALLIFLIFLFIMLLFYIRVDYGETKPNYWKENNENKANCILMSKKAFELVDKELIVGELDSSVCHVRLTNQKNYDIYLKMKSDNQEWYYYLKNDGKYLTVEGDTSQIDKWMKEKQEGSLLQEEEKMLQLSNGLLKSYQEMIQTAETEDIAIKNRSNTSQKYYYYLKKDELYSKK